MADHDPDTTTSDAILLRNSLRDLFALLGIASLVQYGTVGTRRSIVVSPLSLGDATKLLRALAPGSDTGVTPR